MFSLAHGDAEQMHLQAKDHWGPTFADPMIDSNTLFFQFITRGKGQRKHVTQDKTEEEEHEVRGTHFKEKGQVT